MVMVDFSDPFVVLALAFCAGTVVLLLKTTYDFEKRLSRQSKHLSDVLGSLENQALELKAKAQDLQKTMDQKTDYAYLDKRIDGLVQLIKTK